MSKRPFEELLFVEWMEYYHFCVYLVARAKEKLGIDLEPTSDGQVYADTQPGYYLRVVSKGVQIISIDQPDIDPQAWADLIPNNSINIVPIEVVTKKRKYKNRNFISIEYSPI